MKALTRILIYGALFAAAVPWYWQVWPATANSLVLGMPLWVVTAILGSAAISLFTACLLRQRWPSEESQGQHG